MLQIQTRQSESKSYGQADQVEKIKKMEEVEEVEGRVDRFVSVAY